jgi:prepilin-type N-terminal cleavage/methylation domain-containing protein
MNIHPKHSGCYRAGFTLAELLLSLSVMTIVLTGAASLAFAMGVAESVTSQMGEEQARIRFATMRLRELARNSCMVFTNSTTGVVFWTGDANGDGQINGNEVAWLSTNAGGGAGTVLKITEFPDHSSVITRHALQFQSGLSTLTLMSDEIVTNLFEDCSSVTISLKDNITTVAITLVEGNQAKELQICAAIRSSVDYLLTSPTSNLVTGDDDF